MMLNDRSTPLSLLETRRSGTPREMVAPGPERRGARANPRPSPRAFPTMASCPRGASSPSPTTSATRSPTCSPARSPRMTRRAARALRQGDAIRAPGAGAGRARLARRSQDHKIPVWEQQLSCGAAGDEPAARRPRAGLCRRLGHRLAAYSEHVRAAFCEPGERIAGFIFIGRPARELEERPRARARTTFVRRWPPPQDLEP